VKINQQKEIIRANTELVTGASTGIGAELARYHASKGGDIVLISRSENRLSKLKSMIEVAHSIKPKTHWIVNRTLK
jgi:short-subunit dehydrogenase